MSARAWERRRSKGTKFWVLHEHPCGCAGYKLGTEKVRVPCWEHQTAEVRARATAAHEEHQRWLAERHQRRLPSSRIGSVGTPETVVQDYDEGAWCAPENPSCGACPTCTATAPASLCSRCEGTGVERVGNDTDGHAWAPCGRGCPEAAPARETP